MTKRGRAVFYSVFSVIFILITAFLFWKCSYGFGNMDESFYLTIPYRLTMGDGLLLHEWHLTQTSSILLVPFVRLHLLLFGGTEGILLHFRYLFVFVWSLASAFVFYRLKRIHLFGAAAGAVMLLIYAPFSIMALSYNSMGIMTLLLAVVIPLTAEKYRKIQHVISGSFFAAAVLCCPYLIALYLIFTAFVIVNRLLPAKMLKSDAGERRKRIVRFWLFGTLGAAILALIFTVYVLSRAPLSSVTQALPMMFEDPEHPKYSFLFKTKLYFDAIYINNPYFLAILISSAVLFAAAKIKKSLKIYCLILMAAVTGFYIVSQLLASKYLNYMMFPICLMGLFCAFIGKNPTARRLFYGMYLPGAAYSYCINYSSNQGFYSLSSAMTVAAVASAVIICLCISDEVKESQTNGVWKRIAVAAVSIVFCFQILSELNLRYSNVFWEPGSVKAQTVRLTYGPEKGILASEGKARAYEDYMADIEAIRNADQDKLLVLSKQTWLYLSCEKEFAAFSAWLSGINDFTMTRLEKYYSLCPDKIPEIIFLDASCADYSAYLQSKGYTAETTQHGNIILYKVI